MIKYKQGKPSIKGIRTFLKVGTCSETLFNEINRAYQNPQIMEENASMPLAGGIMQHGYQCGMIWGAALGAGAHSYEVYGSGAKAEMMSILASQNIVDAFRKQNKHINCFEITELDLTSTAWKMILFFVVKGGVIGCFKMAATYPPLALSAIEDTFAKAPVESPGRPLSCAAEVARRLGATEKQATMASGLAGGIGLCGGACGALGTAVWMNALASDKGENIKPDFKDPEIMKLIQRFQKHTDYKFECSDIVGRKFANVQDHASYMAEGGCKEILDLLADYK